MATTQADRETLAARLNEFELFVTPNPNGDASPLPAHLIPESVNGERFAFIQADNGEYLHITTWDKLVTKLDNTDPRLPRELCFYVSEACKVPQDFSFQDLRETLKNLTPNT